MKTLSFMLLGIVLGSWVSSGFSQEYTVGVEELAYLPYSAVSQGEYHGFGRDVLDKFAEKQKITFHYRPYPVKRLTSSFLNGELDFKYPDNSYWSQEAKTGLTVHYSKPVVGYTDGVMVIPGRLGKGIDGFKTLGTLRGFTPWDYLGLIKTQQIKARELNTLDSLIQMAQNERVDGAYFNVAVANYFLTHNMNKPGTLVFDPDLPHTNSTYSLSTLKHETLLKQFNAFLDEESVWISALREKYSIDQ